MSSGESKADVGGAAFCRGPVPDRLTIKGSWAYCRDCALKIYYSALLKCWTHSTPKPEEICVNCGYMRKVKPGACDFCKSDDIEDVP